MDTNRKRRYIAHTGTQGAGLTDKSGKGPAMTIDQLTAAVSVFEVANCEWEILIGSEFRIGKAAKVAAAEVARKSAAINSKEAIDAAPEAVRQEWLASQYNRLTFAKMRSACQK